MTDRNLIIEALEHYWGAQCDDYDDTCVICQAWEQYEDLCDGSPVGCVSTDHAAPGPDSMGVGCVSPSVKLEVQSDD